MLFAALIAAVIVALVAVPGLVPRGGRPVANTQMMTVARVVLVVIGIVIAVLLTRQ
jgi:hypothetical protein